MQLYYWSRPRRKKKKIKPPSQQIAAPDLRTANQNDCISGLSPVLMPAHSAETDNQSSEDSLCYGYRCTQ